MLNVDLVLITQASDDVQFSKESVNHVCLLDCMHLDLSDMDLFSAERVEHVNFNARDDTAMIFPSFVICRKVGHPFLKQI